MSNLVSLFVYGSFSKGGVHASRVEEFVRSRQRAEAQGSVYRLQVGYPVFVCDGSASIPGEVLELSAPDILYKLLDEFHGYSPLTPEKSLYVRTPITVKGLHGVPMETFIYALNPAKLPTGVELIADGDWEKALRDRPALTESLTDRQINYVRKLGASSGRDIVPIDLDLYRELMKMDLIVDKGRRLALTKLGKEVYRYLR